MAVDYRERWIIVKDRALTNSDIRKIVSKTG